MPYVSLRSMHSVCYGTGGKFQLVINFTELHTLDLTLAACSYILLLAANLNVPLKEQDLHRKSEMIRTILIDPLLHFKFL